VSIRDNTPFREKIGVRRVWKHPVRESKEVPGAYYDIAIMELERRIIYDYDKYGDSPVCLGKNKDIPDGPALQQGAGLTEDDELAGVRDVGVKIIQNQLCYEKFAALSRRKLTSRYS